MLHRSIGLAGAAVVLLCAGTVLAAHRAGAAQARELADQARSLEEVELRLARLAEKEGAETRLADLQRTLEEVRRRIAALERSPRRPVAPESSAPEPAAEPSPPAGDDEPEVPAESTRASSPELRAELDRLLEELMGPGLDLDGSSEEQARLWELLRTPGLVDERIAELEDRVALDPGNTGLRMTLADSYIAKLYAVPGGPEQGLWGGKAEEQWREVVALDPDHWEAQFTLANNLAYYPDVMGRTGEAIAGLERAREIQERLQPSTEHVQTYLSLSRLYLRSGKTDRAREQLEAGLYHHPGDARLTAALAGLEGQ